MPYSRAESSLASAGDVFSGVPLRGLEWESRPAGSAETQIKIGDEATFDAESSVCHGHARLLDDVVRHSLPGCQLLGGKLGHLVRVQLGETRGRC